MAALQFRHGSYRILFRYAGKQHAFTLGEVSKEEAVAKLGMANYLLLRLAQRLAEVPAGTPIADYLKFDGQPAPPDVPARNKSAVVPAQIAEVAAPVCSAITLAQLRDQFLMARESAWEASTLATVRMHFRHLAAHFGETFPITSLTAADLQTYVNGRCKPKGPSKQGVSAATAEKEVITLRTAWNWGRTMSLTSADFPGRGLAYPKTDEKPRFQTLAEIKRQISAGVGDPERAALFDSLYLQACEVTELLTFVHGKAAHPFIYPMVCFAAHTGARRSELFRARIADVDMEARIVTIRERKRVRGQRTTRQVPMSQFLFQTMETWLAVHPGGPWLFCHSGTVARSRKRNPKTGTHRESVSTSHRAQRTLMGARQPVNSLPLTKDEAHDHFKRTLRGGKWSIIRGWHVLRHSFISACASRGVDQRLVETWAGHMSPEMSWRYAHLYPSTQQAAIAQVFDNPLGA